VTKAIADLLGVDRVGFLASVFSRQKDLEGLASLDGNDRTRTVLRLRGLDAITKAIEAVNEEAKEYRRSLAAFKSLVPNPRPLGEYDRDIEALEGRLDKLHVEEEQLRHQLSELDQEVASLDADALRLAPERIRFTEYSKKKGSLEARLGAAREALEEAQKLAAEPLKDAPKPPSVTVDPKEYARLVDKQTEDREFMRTLRTTLDSDESCPTCLRPFDNAEELAKAKAQAQKAWDAAGKRMEKRGPRIEELEKIIKEEAEFREANQKWLHIDRASWQSRQVAVGAREKAVEALVTQLEGLEPVEDAGSEYDALVAQVRKTENRAAKVRESLVTLEGQEENLTHQLMTLQEQRTQVEEAGERIKVLESSSVESDVTVGLLKEFKRDQISRLTPEISAKASNILADLTDGKYTELILTPDWDIQYRFENGDVKGFHLLSVGERNTFALALRLALADLRAGNIGLLVLDEVLDAMDEDRQNLTWATLEGLLTRYEQIVVITHVSAFKERAPHVISL
jgi:DNA repair exonuclease SbcCD ATPase subunit